MIDTSETLLMPANLWDVVQRLMAGGEVYGFELHLLAEYVSR